MLDLNVQTYNSFDLDQAIGTALDRAAQYTGIFRKGGVYTQVVIQVVASAIVTLQGQDTATPFTISDINGNFFQLVTTTALSIGTNNLTFQAVNIGFIQILANTLTVQVTPTLGVTIEKCLGDWLLSEQPMESAMNLVPVNGPGKLALIAPSSPKAKLIEVIGRRPISAWLNSHSTDWDCVLIDAPCLIPDRLLEMVLPLYSNLILTAEYHRTKMSELTLACSIARSRQWRVMGVVITDSPRIAS